MSHYIINYGKSIETNFSECLILPESSKPIAIYEPKFQKNTEPSQFWLIFENFKPKLTWEHRNYFRIVSQLHPSEI